MRQEFYKPCIRVKKELYILTFNASRILSNGLNTSRYTTYFLRDLRSIPWVIFETIAKFLALKQFMLFRNLIHRNNKLLLLKPLRRKIFRFWFKDLILLIWKGHCMICTSVVTLLLWYSSVSAAFVFVGAYAYLEILFFFVFRSPTRSVFTWLS